MGRMGWLAGPHHLTMHMRWAKRPRANGQKRNTVRRTQSMYSYTNLMYCYECRDFGTFYYIVCWRAIIGQNYSLIFFFWHIPQADRKDGIAYGIRKTWPAERFYILPVAFERIFPFFSPVFFLLLIFAFGSPTRESFQSRNSYTFLNELRSLYARYTLIYEHKIRMNCFQASEWSDVRDERRKLTHRNVSCLHHHVTPSMVWFCFVYVITELALFSGPRLSRCYQRAFVFHSEPLHEYQI